ncbi:MAG: response regulator [Nitrospira sp.]|nr:response regulator [Nitrospira sp.]
MNEESEAPVDDRTRDLVLSQDRLRALAAELNLAEQRERQRLATELHDYLAQLLALRKIKLAQAKQMPMAPAVGKAVTDVDQVMDQALAYTRTLVVQLSPPVLKQFRLPTALKWLVEQMQQRNLTVKLELKSETLSLPEEQAVLLFQSIRELLMNVVKHAGTTQARISVEHVSDRLSITVSDQGAGFDLFADPPGTGSEPSFGLFSIRERMTALGGSFELLSQPGQGTLATLLVPLESSEKTSESAAGSTVLGDEKTEPAKGRSPDNSTARTQHSEFNPQPKVRVLLVDDHAMVRQGLKSILDAYQDISIIGEAADGEEAVKKAIGLSPDVVVMDVNMPRMDGIQATRHIETERLAAMVIGLSIQNVEDVETAMKEAGAAAFVNKEAAVEDLYETIQQVTREHRRIASEKSVEK